MRWTFTTTSTASTMNDSLFMVRVQVRPIDPPLPEAFVRAVYDACAWLELEPPFASDAPRQARKRLAKRCHPDAGGDVAMMQQVNAGADFLLGLR